MTGRSTYFVWCDHTLLYKIEGDLFYGVLSGNVLKGGADPLRGVVSPMAEDLRPATRDDFDAFRVCSKHYDLQGRSPSAPDASEGPHLPRV